MTICQNSTRTSTGQFIHNSRVCNTTWMYESGEDCDVVLEIKHLTWSGNIVYSYWCKVFGWVGGSLCLSLTLALTLSLWGFTSHCSASKSVRTLWLLWWRDIKRWLDHSWNKDWMGQRREGTDKRDKLLNQDVVEGDRRWYVERGLAVFFLRKSVIFNSFW